MLKKRIRSSLFGFRDSQTNHGLRTTNHEQRTANSDAGFSLLELIIAIAVLAIGLVGVLQIFPVGLRASQRSGMTTKAAFLAQNKIEEIKIAGFDAIAEIPPEFALSGTQGDFDWEIFIDDVELDGIESQENIKEVVVTVRWTEQNKLRSKDFVTYVAK